MKFSAFCILVALLNVAQTSIGENTSIFASIPRDSDNTVLINNAPKQVDFSFLRRDDLWAYTALSPRIKHAELVCEEIEIPQLYFLGEFDSFANKLTIQRWFLVGPFREINSLSDGTYDPKKTSIRLSLSKDDFSLVETILWKGDLQEMDYPSDLDLNRYIADLTKIFPELIP